MQRTAHTASHRPAGRRRCESDRNDRPGLRGGAACALQSREEFFRKRLHALLAGIDDQVGNLAVKRIALGVERIQLFPGVRRCKQRAIAIMPYALPEVLHTRVQVNDSAAGRDNAAILLRKHRSPAGGKYGVCQRAELGNYLRFARPESSLAFDIENHGDAYAAAALDLLVGVVKTSLQAPREQPAHGGLARAHHADKDEAALRIHGAILRSWKDVEAESKTAGGNPAVRLYLDETSAAGQALVHDARRDEDQQLGLVPGRRRIAEQEPDIGQIPEERGPRRIDVVDLLIYPADHHGAAVLHQHLGLDVFRADLHAEVGDRARDVLVHVERHDDV